MVSNRAILSSESVSCLVLVSYPESLSREQRRRSLEIGTMRGEISDLRSPVCIWEKQPTSSSQHVSRSNNGFPKEWLGGWWSKYYDIMPRQPYRNKELSPWAASRFRKLPGGSVEIFDHVKVEMEHKLQHPSYWKAGTGVVGTPEIEKTHNDVG